MKTANISRPWPAGLQSLAQGAGLHFRDGNVRQIIIEMEKAFLFIIAAGNGTCLAVLTSADPNVGVIAYEMAMLVRRMGKYLAAEPRFRDDEIARSDLPRRLRGSLARPGSRASGPAVCRDEGTDTNQGASNRSA